MAITGNVGVLHRYIHTLVVTSAAEAEGSTQTVVEAKNERAAGSSRAASEDRRAAYWVCLQPPHVQISTLDIKHNLVELHAG